MTKMGTGRREGPSKQASKHQDLELCGRARKVLLLQLLLPGHVPLEKVMGLSRATQCCRTALLVPNGLIMNNVIMIDTAQGLFLILNND